MKYVAPKIFLASFTCPHCGVLSQQYWWARNFDNNVYANNINNHLRVGRCEHCHDSTLWIDDTMYFPDTGKSEFPNPEMPAVVKAIYLEAASIHSKSPRGAAALLRLAIQVLCKELGEDGSNINTDIKSLVKKGLPEIVQQSLDIVRVTGNDAVHPGLIDADNEDTVSNLFHLINIVVEYMIALPKRVSGIYSLLPADKLKGIKNRDNN